MPARRLALASVAVLVTAACSGAGPSTEPGAADGVRPAKPVSATDSQQKTASLVATAQGPVGQAVDAQGRVWVANADDGSVSRLDAAGDRVDFTRKVGVAPLRLAATQHSVWVTVFNEGSVKQLDVTTG